MKMIHCGDIHFDTPFTGLADARKAALRQEDVRRTFGRIVALAAEEKADLLLIAGDLLDGDTASPETIRYVQEKLGSLVDTRVFLCGGNHDPVTPRSYYRLLDWPDNVHIFDTQMECVPLPQWNACIYGCSFSQRYEPASLLAGFRVEDPQKCNLMLLHGQLVGTGQQSQYDPIYEADIAQSGLTYLALGHTHTYTGPLYAGKTCYAMCGCPEGRGFDEAGPRGAVVAEVDADGASLRFVSLCRRQYHTVTLDVTGAAHHEELADRLRAALPGTAEDLYQIVLCGEAAFPVNSDVLLDGLPCFSAKVVDETRAQLDLVALREDFSLRGLFVDELLQMEDSPVVRRAMQYGLAALSGEKVVL